MATKGKEKTTKKSTKTVEKVVETQVEETPNGNVEEEVTQTSTEASVAEVVANAMANALATEIKKAEATEGYKEDDSILCKSITGGELILIGSKSGEKYIWSNRDDVCEVMVKDLNSLKAKKSNYLYKPLFIIVDDEFMEQPRWADLKKMYDNSILEDINELLNMPLADFKRTLSSLPEGYKRVLCDEAATRIHSNEFDSLNKIKAIDEICGTDLRCLIS